MNDWIRALKTRTAEGRSAILVSIAAAKGSVPRPPGTRMIVSADGIDGTIGGGHLEHKAIAIARDLLVARGPRALHRFPLGASLGQCCGGLAQLLFEPIGADAAWVDAIERVRADGLDCGVVVPVQGAEPAGRLIVTTRSTLGTLNPSSYDDEATSIARALLAGNGAPGLATLGGREGLQVFVDLVRVPDFSILLLGAGHVGRAIVRTFAHIACRIHWIDSRDDAFPASVPEHVTCVCTDAPEAEVAAAPAGAYFLVMTHSHAQDEILAECILKRADFAYFGLIGSVSKRRQFEKRLEARGISRAILATMTCPIGIAGITGKEPEVIAIAVAAEMLLVRGRMLGQAAVATTRRARVNERHNGRDGGRSSGGKP